MSTDKNTSPKTTIDKLNIKQFLGTLGLSKLKKGSFLMAFRNEEPKTPAQWEKAINSRYPKLDFKLKK